MMKLQVALVLAAVVLCCSNVEARGGRRMMSYQQTYTPYYNTAAPVASSTPTVITPAQTTVTSPSNIVQANSTAPATGVVQANAAAPAAATSTPATTTVAAPAVAAVGSAQWKAEQSARMGSVAHIGGGFGGGSYEGNGFGATADQAIRNACFWGQRTPIEIGVARGANGYYATIFYR